jgi:ppGpp synthetase/RelA/SpoT-type nucleotidyltranferase
MPNRLTRTRVDNLGERLRTGKSSNDDLDLLDAYRESFESAYRQVVNTTRQSASAAPSGRPGKSTTSIIDKLSRETVRLSQMQDIAGCRLVVDDPEVQDLTVNRLQTALAALGRVRIVDRRRHPSYGYRAVHVIVTIDGKPVEVQVRTLIQHLWAELSEKAADRFGIEVKYGGSVVGHPEIREMLDSLSEALEEVEEAQRQGGESRLRMEFAAAVALRIGDVIVGQEP